MITYRIKDWNEHFENFKSRERDRCSYVCLPNKQHGLGLSRILSMEDGAAIFGIWVLIVEACSRQKRPRDGWLTQDGYQTGTPWIPSDLALMWRRTEAEIQRALDVLSSPEIGWVEVSAQYPASIRPVSAESPLGIPERKGKEGKGRETAAASGPQTPPVDPQTSEPTPPAAAAFLLKETFSPFPPMSPKRAAIIRGLQMRAALAPYHDDEGLISALADSLPSGRLTRFLDAMTAALAKNGIQDKRNYILGALRKEIEMLDQDDKAALKRERKAMAAVAEMEEGKA